MNLVKSSSLVIQLTLNGRIIGEVRSKDLKSEITIGRSEQCTWQIPSDDRSASGVHARIFPSGRKVLIEDLKSRNGVYFMGARIPKRKLAVGDVYGIGDCKLTVEADLQDRKSGKSQEKYHKLEQLTGQNRGKIYALKDSHIKIGAAPECTIVLNDSLVSKLHAVLENHSDDTCWVKDMGSRNGTKVNGTLLNEENAETGRMLKDGDVISIAYLDFRFWDKTVVHIRSHIFLKIGVVAATLAIVLGGYFAFQAISPSAKYLRLAAEKRAAVCDFDGARELIKAATTARGADADAQQRLDLARKIDIWEETSESWETIRELLDGTPSSNKLAEANRLLGQIASSDRERWQWNVSEASQEMKKAQETHMLLSTLLGIKDRLNRANEDVAYFRENRSKLKDAMEVCRGNPQPYQAAIQAEAADLLGEMDFQLQENGAVQTVVSGCTDAGKLERTIESLEKIKKEASERIDQRKKAKKAYSQSVDALCKKMLDVMNALHKSRLLLDANCLAVAQFEFKKVQDELSLPSVEECMLAPNLSKCRLEIEQDNLRLKQIVIQLQNFRTFFSDNEIAPGQNSPLFAVLFDQDIWEKKILSCDCLKQAPPAYSEKTARSEYDKVLGVYVFWEYLRSIGGEFDTTVFEERFKPDLFRAREIFGHLDTFRTFCAPRSDSNLYKVMKRLLAEKDGKSILNDYLAQAGRILAKRDTLVDRMYEVNRKKPDSRAGIIAGGVALYLLPENWKKFKSEDLADSVVKSLKELRQTLADISGREATPEQMLENEMELLAKGIPGDSFLRQPWADHASAVSMDRKPEPGNDKSDDDDEDDEDDDDDDDEDDEEKTETKGKKEKK